MEICSKICPNQVILKIFRVVSVSAVLAQISNDNTHQHCHHNNKIIDNIIRFPLSLISSFFVGFSSPENVCSQIPVICCHCGFQATLSLVMAGALQDKGVVLSRLISLECRAALVSNVSLWLTCWWYYSYCEYRHFVILMSPQNAAWTLAKLSCAGAICR